MTNTADFAPSRPALDGPGALELLEEPTDEAVAGADGVEEGGGVGRDLLARDPQCPRCPAMARLYGWHRAGRGFLCYARAGSL